MTSEVDETRTLGRSDAPRASLVPERRTIGRYRLSYEIASGGQAAVYVGVTDGPGGFEKVVAVKVLHRHFTKDPSSVAQFLDEARLAARLTHPNVCGVIDFGIEEREHFLAMEFIPGITASKLLARAVELAAEGRLDHERWAPIVGLVVSAVAEGLYAVHDLRDPSGERLHVVHRDVSPKNVMIGFDGSVRLMDFGIARYDARASDTNAGAVKGTASYMSPEQAQGEPVDARTDVWALAVVAWEMLTLRRLFRRATPAATMQAVVEGPIPAPSTHDAGLSAQTDAALGFALVRDLDARLDDARTFGSMLVEGVGRASAADLAAWVREAFPSAEVESRSLVDLARQAAGSLPSATQAMEERKRHLAAIALLQSARGMLVEIERDVAAGASGPEVEERIGECRLTLLQASREWPGDAEIRTGLDAILVLAARHEIRRENATLARSLLSRASREDATVSAELAALEARLADRREEEARLAAIARESDLRIGLRSRAASLGALIVGALIVLWLALTHGREDITHEELLEIASVQLGVVVVGLVALSRNLAKNAAGRRFGALVLAVAVSGLLHRVVGASLGLSVVAVLTLDLVRHALGVAAAGLLVPRVALAVVVPLGALALAAHDPAQAPRLVGVSSVVTLVAVTVLGLWGLRPEAAKDTAR